MPKFSFKFLIIILNSSFLIFHFSAKAKALTKTTSTTETISAEVPSTSTPTDTTPPLPPILISPPNDTYTNNPLIHFIWKQTTDPNSNTVFYTLNLLNSKFQLLNSFSNLPSTANLIKTNFHTLAQPDIFHLILDQPLSEGSYTWSVTASDANNNQASSAQFHFTLDLTPPPLILTTIDDHSNLNFSSSSSPLSLNLDPSLNTQHTLTFQTEPNALVTLTFTNPQTNQTSTLSSRCPSSPNPCFLNFNFPKNLTTNHQLLLTATAIDLATNTTTLPPITLFLKPKTQNLTSKIHYLPATLAQIQPSRQNLALLFIFLLAISLILLLIYQRKRRWNLLITIILPPPTIQDPTSNIYDLPPNTNNPTSTTQHLKPNIYDLTPSPQDLQITIKMGTLRFVTSPLQVIGGVYPGLPGQPNMHNKRRTENGERKISTLNSKFYIPNSKLHLPLTLYLTSKTQHLKPNIYNPLSNIYDLRTTFCLLPFYRRWHLKFDLTKQ